MHKREKRDLRAITWKKVKPLVMNDMVNAGADTECDDFRYLVAEACLNGYALMDDMPLSFVEDTIARSGLVWLEEHKYITEDKTALLKWTIQEIQKFAEERKEQYENSGTSVPFVAFVDFLIESGTITKRNLEKITGKRP